MPGLTIDRFDISIYNLYAIRTKMQEEGIQIQDAASIPMQTQVLDTYARPTDLDLLLGIVPIATPWAYFFAPKDFGVLRRPFLSFYRVAPSMGTFEEQADDAEKLQAVPCPTPEDESDKQTILGCFETINKINDWLGFIIGRIGQFLQG